MQPYFFPYIGYFQLMNAVDEFIVYDNIEFTKKGWIHRNRILVNGADTFISLPLRKDSDFLDIGSRYLADVWPEERQKLLNRIKEAYRKAPQFESVFQLVQDCLQVEERNLFKFLLFSLAAVKDYLDIATSFQISSTIPIDHSLRAEEKVLALCKAREADTYLNPIGGVELYSKSVFKQNNVELNFLKANDIQYSQFSNEFVPFLSIIDVMMFNSKSQVKEFLKQYTIQ